MTPADNTETDIRGRHPGGRHALYLYSAVTRHSPTWTLVEDTLWDVTLADDNSGLYSHERHSRATFPRMILAD
jgi:hypothetical protein